MDLPPHVGCFLRVLVAVQITDVQQAVKFRSGTVQPAAAGRVTANQRVGQ
jgi:hypothetical protein